MTIFSNSLFFWYPIFFVKYQKNEFYVFANFYENPAVLLDSVAREFWLREYITKLNEKPAVFLDFVAVAKITLIKKLL